MLCPKCKGLMVDEWGDVRCLNCGARPVVEPLDRGKWISAKRMAQIEKRRAHERQRRLDNPDAERQRKRLYWKRRRIKIAKQKVLAGPV